MIDLGKIESEINACLERWGAESLDATNYHFVRETEIIDAKNPNFPSVNGGQLISAVEFTEVFQRELSGGPSWIHFEVLPVRDSSRFIVGVSFGAAVGNPNPSINVSFGKNRFIAIESGETSAKSVSVGTHREQTR